MSLDIPRKERCKRCGCPKTKCTCETVRRIKADGYIGGTSGPFSLKRKANKKSNAAD